MPQPRWRGWVLRLGQHLIEGDNLEVLKLLQRGYHSTYDFIYIDPYCICKTGVYLKSFVFGMCGLVAERLPVATHAGAGQPEALLLGVGLKRETFAEAMEKHPNAGKVRHFPRALLTPPRFPRRRPPLQPSLSPLAGLNHAL